MRSIVTFGRANDDAVVTVGRSYRSRSDGIPASKDCAATSRAGAALVKSAYPFFTRQQIARCEADLSNAEQNLKNLYEHIFADTAFKTCPLAPTGVLEQRMREAASLEAECERLRKLKTLQVRWNAAIRAGVKTLPQAQAAFDKWGSTLFTSQARGFKGYDEWVMRLNSEADHEDEGVE